MQVLLISLFGILWTIFTLPAQAIEVEVKVFEKGINAMEARAKALANAEKRGFAAVVKQKAPDEAEQILKDYEGYNISPYILGYHAKNEVVTDTSYRAVLVLDFDDQFISNALQQTTAVQNATTTPTAPFDTTMQATGDAILVLPVFRSPRGVMLWEENNLWRQHINQMVLQHGHGEFVVPYGDPTDRLSVNASNIMTANFARLAPLLQRYGANRALIAAIGERGANGFSLTLRELSPQGDTLNIKHVEPDEKLSANQLLQVAAEDLIQNYLKQQQLAENPEEALENESHVIGARISLNNARDWGELRARLQAIKVLDDIQVLNADASGMALQLTFRGQPRSFGEALVKNGIAATQQNEELWLALR